MRVSQYVFPITLPYTTDIALYHALSMEIIYCSQEIYSVFKAPDDNYNNKKYKPYIQQFIDKKFLIPDDKDEDYVHYIDTSMDIYIMYLLLTDMCNLKCKYCTVQYNLQTKPNIMDNDTIFNSIRMFKMLHTSSKKRNITFFGGEPVLNISGLRFGLEQINKLFESEERNIFIVTNGIYITDEIVRLFKEYRVFPIVSIDGWEEIHNHMRVYGNGHGSYNDTITGYNLLQKNGINIGISTLIGKHNYKYLPEIVEFFIHELKAFNLGISLPHVKPDIAEVSIEELTPVLIRCWEIARDNNFYIMQIGKRLKALATKKANLRSCPGADTWSMLRVLPDGTITPCENMGLRGEAILGNVNDNISPDEILNHHVLYSWNRRSPYTMAECSKCMCINICGGGCPYDAFLETDSIYQPERRSCYLSIELLKWAVKEIYKHVDMDDKLVIPTREQRYAILPQQLPYFV